MPQRSQRDQEREVRKELRQKKRRLSQLTKQRQGIKEGRKTEEMLKLEQRIRHLQDWLTG
jgi:hypothetical protein